MAALSKALGKFAAFVLLAGIAFGLFVVVVLPFTMFEKAQAEAWPSRKGVITLSYAHHKRSWTNGWYWRPELCGTYKDDGQRFCVVRVRYGSFRFGEGKAQALEAVARYPVGREVDVYYAPDDPGKTVLEAISPWTEMFTLLGFGIGFLLLPVLLWLFRKRIEPERYARE